VGEFGGSQRRVGLVPVGQAFGVARRAQVHDPHRLDGQLGSTGLVDNGLQRGSDLGAATRRAGGFQVPDPREGTRSAGHGDRLLAGVAITMSRQVVVFAAARADQVVHAVHVRSGVGCPGHDC